MRFLAQTINIIDNLNEWFGKIFGFLIIILMGVVVYDTVMRYVFNSPTIWGMDLNKILLLAVVCLGGGYCFLHGGHVKVDILYLRFSSRKRAVIDLLTHIFVLLFCYLVVKHGGYVAWRSFSIGETSSESAWEYIMWPVLMLIPFAGILLGLQTLAKWIRDLIIALTGENKMESRVVRGAGGLRG